MGLVVVSLITLHLLHMVSTYVSLYLLRVQARGRGMLVTLGSCPLKNKETSQIPSRLAWPFHCQLTMLLPKNAPTASAAYGPTNNISIRTWARKPKRMRAEGPEATKPTERLMIYTRTEVNSGTGHQESDVVLLTVLWLTCCRITFPICNASGYPSIRRFSASVVEWLVVFVAVFFFFFFFWSVWPGHKETIQERSSST